MIHSELTSEEYKIFCDLIYRTAGTSDSARQGTMIGRIFRNMAVVNTHPAHQAERTFIAAARTRFGLVPPQAKPAD